MKNIECEERVLLTFEQYQTVLKDFVCKFPTKYRYLKNTNIYFDDENHTLIKNSFMLRIRKINDEQEELTLKIKQKEGDLEINETVDNHPLIDEHLLISFEKLKPITSLTTRRVEIDIDDYMVVIDMNNFNKDVDFDLEIEAPTKERALEIILEICKKYNIEYKNDYPGKSRRAFASINNN